MKAEYHLIAGLSLVLSLAHMAPFLPPKARLIAAAVWLGVGASFFAASWGM
jgi:hypothetical protein